MHQKHTKPKQQQNCSHDIVMWLFSLLTLKCSENSTNFFFPIQYTSLKSNSNNAIELCYNVAMRVCVCMCVRVEHPLRLSKLKLLLIIFDFL